MDGFFTPQAVHRDFAPDWTRIVGATSSLFFYRSLDGVANTGAIGAKGVFAQPPGSSYTFYPGEQFFPGTRSGRFLQYSGSHVVPRQLTAGRASRDTRPATGSGAARGGYRTSRAPVPYSTPSLFPA